MGKIFAKNFKVYLVDLRNHGDSPHSDEFNYELMMEDVLELTIDEKMTSFHLLGHSMGGKVAMHLATQHPENIIKLIVVDIAPKYYPPHHQQIFKGFHSVNLSELQSRKDADEQMATVISDFRVRQFILKNLERKKNGSFGWKLNIDAIEKVGEDIESYGSFDKDTLFVAGGNSDYITDQDHELIKNHFPKATIISIKEAGHWVHAEKPEELGKVVIEFLSA